MFLIHAKMAGIAMMMKITTSVPVFEATLDITVKVMLLKDCRGLK